MLDQRFNKVSSDHLQQAASIYGLKFDSVTPMTQGRENANFLVKTKAKDYILGFSLHKTEAQLQNISLILRHLDKHKFPASKVITTPSGEDFIKIYDVYAQLKTYVQGVVITEPNTSQVREIGQYLAHLHNLPIPQEIPRQHDYGHHKMVQETSALPDSSYRDWLQRQLQRIELALKSSQEDKPVMIHGDLFADNILFADGKLSAFIDFEECCVDSRLLELGMTIIGNCNRGGKIDNDLASVLVEAYQDVTPLLPGLGRLIPEFCLYAAVATSFWRYRHYNLRGEDPSQADCYLEMLQLADVIAAQDLRFK